MAHNWRDVPIPESLAKRPRSKQGYPIPHSALILPDGTPDFRIIDVPKQLDAIRRRRCGMCFAPLGYWAVVLGGLLVELNKISTDPPMCEPCAVYAAQVCPYLSNDSRRFSERPLSVDTVSDAANTYNKQAVMLMLYANDWHAIKGNQEGMVYAKITRWHPTKTRYFANGVELDERSAFDLMRDNPPDEETIYALHMAAQEHKTDRLNRQMALTLIALNENRLI